jgi:alpha-beta hydrolase superfamily lysophospholipase
VSDTVVNTMSVSDQGPEAVPAGARRPQRRLRRRVAVAAALLTCVIAVTSIVVLVANDFAIDEQNVQIPIDPGVLHAAGEVPDADRNVLQAVLALPEERKRPVGLVVFVHGDGPARAAYDGLYRPLWEAFARAGYASLSWDKPGVEGAAGDWLAQSMDDRAREVEAAITWARRRADIDPRRIGLWGASQAGWVLPKVAGRVRGLQFVIAESPAINWLRQGRYNTHAEQRERGDTPEQIAAEARLHTRSLALLRRGASYAEYRRVMGADADLSAARWTFVRRNFRADATRDLPALRDTPVLLVTAGHDRNVDAVETTRTYRRILDIPGRLRIRHYPDALHSIERASLEHSELRETLTAVFAPRSLSAPGYLDDQRRFLAGR